MNTRILENGHGFPHPLKKHKIDFIPVFPKKYGSPAGDGNCSIFLLKKAFVPTFYKTSWKRMSICYLVFLSQSISEYLGSPRFGDLTVP